MMASDYNFKQLLYCKLWCTAYNGVFLRADNRRRRRLYRRTHDTMVFLIFKKDNIFGRFPVSVRRSTMLLVCMLSMNKISRFTIQWMLHFTLPNTYNHSRKRGSFNLKFKKKGEKNTGTNNSILVHYWRSLMKLQDGSQVGSTFFGKKSR